MYSKGSISTLCCAFCLWFGYMEIMVIYLLVGLILSCFNLGLLEINGFSKV